MARFEYQEDALQPGEIRLLRVQKAPNAKEFPLGGGPDSNSTPLYAPIQCEIATYKLRDCPPFTALSSTWGAEDNEKEISLNGLSKTVRPNLARFLRHARDDMNSYPSGSASSWRQEKRGKRSYFYPLTCSGKWWLLSRRGISWALVWRTTEMMHCNIYPTRAPGLSLVERKGLLVHHGPKKGWGNQCIHWWTASKRQVRSGGL
jgi:hypothetical protein